MPPRYAYWTILVDELPTAFRAALLEDLQPTFSRLKAKHPSARLVWFQNGKVWNSRLDAQEAMRERGDRGRMGDARQRPPRRDFGAPPERTDGKLEWRPKSSENPPARPPSPKPSRPHALTPSRPQALRPSRPEWKPKPKFGDRRPRQAREDRKPFAPSRRPPAPRRESGQKLEWRPKGAAPTEPREKRKWVPKEEYVKTSRPQDPKTSGDPAKSRERRDRNWRPGGEHKDPRQKYKDAKKAKWTRFKQIVRKRWEGKGGKKERG